MIFIGNFNYLCMSMNRMGSPPNNRLGMWISLFCFLFLLDLDYQYIFYYHLVCYICYAYYFAQNLKRIPNYKD